MSRVVAETAFRALSASNFRHGWARDNRPSGLSGGGATATSGQPV